jgi:phenylalanyl-tRNA synthetase beta chain
MIYSVKKELSKHFKVRNHQTHTPVFLGMTETPKYKVVPPQENMVMHIKSETKQIRPFIVCAVLRGIKFTEENYKSFIDLQDKLHHNICRKRTLVAIGTHDLKTLTPPFTYEAKSPKDIRFIPLNKKKEFSSDELLNYFETVLLYSLF